jgi:hypothetical protein
LGIIEGGYRFGASYGGITPYAAIQAQSFHTSGYTARFDRVLAVYSSAVLALVSPLLR